MGRVQVFPVIFEAQSFYAEIGYLVDFAWRTKHVDTDEGVDERLWQEYRGICQKYGRKEVLHRMSTQVEALAKEIMTRHRKELSQ
jgi:hypothetical protein